MLTSTYIKRAFDLVVSILLLIIFLPFFLVASTLILIFDGYPIIFRTKRAGINNRPFEIYKFRTMVLDADKIGPSVTYGEDPRITKIGRFLRKSKMDELPQIYNVIKGDMSIVGPRPESIDIVEKYYNEDQMRTLSVKPGLTGPGELYYARYQQDEVVSNPESPDYYVQYQLPEKIKLDIDYMENFKKFGILLDIKVIIQTAYIIMLCLFSRSKPVVQRSRIIHKIR